MVKKTRLMKISLPVAMTTIHLLLIHQRVKIMNIMTKKMSHLIILKIKFKTKLVIFKISKFKFKLPRIKMIKIRRKGKGKLARARKTS